jgi:predicted ribosomally synthesized peptide with nif11-like leader
MSVADLRAYGQRAAEDAAVRQRAKEIGIDNVSGQIEYAQTLGFNFNENDMMTLAQEAQGDTELSEDELEAVSGGFVTSTAVAVVGAAAAVVGAAAGVTATTTGSGW